MTDALTATPESPLTSGIAVPVAGEPRTAQSVKTPFQALLNKIGALTKLAKVRFHTAVSQTWSASPASLGAASTIVNGSNGTIWVEYSTGVTTSLKTGDVVLLIGHLYARADTGETGEIAIGSVSSTAFAAGSQTVVDDVGGKFVLIGWYTATGDGDITWKFLYQSGVSEDFTLGGLTSTLAAIVFPAVA